MVGFALFASGNRAIATRGECAQERIFQVKVGITKTTATEVTLQLMKHMHEIPTPTKHMIRKNVNARLPQMAPCSPAVSLHWQHKPRASNFVSIAPFFLRASRPGHSSVQHECNLLLIHESAPSEVVTQMQKTPMSAVRCSVCCFSLACVES